MLKGAVPVRLVLFAVAWGSSARPYGPHAGVSCICVWVSIGSNLCVHSLDPQSVLSECHVRRAPWLVGAGGLGPGLWRGMRIAPWLVL